MSKKIKFLLLAVMLIGIFAVSCTDTSDEELFTASMAAQKIAFVDDDGDETGSTIQFYDDAQDCMYYDFDDNLKYELSLDSVTTSTTAVYKGSGSSEDDAYQYEEDTYDAAGNVTGSTTVTTTAKVSTSVSITVRQLSRGGFVTVSKSSTYSYTTTTGKSSRDTKSSEDIYEFTWK